MVVYPAKGLMARDLALVCHYQGLPLVARPGLGPSTRPSVNALSAAFVEVLQSNVPSAVSTIHRTAARLQVRAAPSATVACVGLWEADAMLQPSGRVSGWMSRALDGGTTGAANPFRLLQAFRWNTPSASSDDGDDEDDTKERLLCPVCRAPMTLGEMVASLRAPAKPADGSAQGTPCCRSCAHQLADVLQPSPAALTGQSGMNDAASAIGPNFPSFVRWRAEALRTGLLLDPEHAD